MKFGYRISDYDFAVRNIRKKVYKIRKPRKMGGFCRTWGDFAYANIGTSDCQLMQQIALVCCRLERRYMYCLKEMRAHCPISKPIQRCIALGLRFRVCKGQAYIMYVYKLSVSLRVPCHSCDIMRVFIL